VLQKRTIFGAYDNIIERSRASGARCALFCRVWRKLRFNAWGFPTFG
jgi:hypothetical protein